MQVPVPTGILSSEAEHKLDTGNSSAGSVWEGYCGQEIISVVYLGGNACLSTQI